MRPKRLCHNIKDLISNLSRLEPTTLLREEEEAAEAEAISC